MLAQLGAQKLIVDKAVPFLFLCSSNRTMLLCFKGQKYIDLQNEDVQTIDTRSHSVYSQVAFLGQLPAMLKAYGYLQRASDTSTNTTKRMKIQGPQTGKAIQTQTQTQKELGPKARQNTEAHKD